jgi:hypothetical protein
MSTILVPTSYHNVVIHHEWKLVMAKEIAALEGTGTWDIVFLFLSMFVPSLVSGFYEINTHSDGSLEHYKARLVAPGFQQEHGHDYHETFPPIAHMTIVRTLIIMAYVRHWSVSHLDVKNAFFNGELCDKVYM